MSKTFELRFTTSTIEEAVKVVTSTNSVEVIDGEFAQYMLQTYIASWPHTTLAKRVNIDLKLRFGYTPGSIGHRLAVFVGLPIASVKPLTSIELRNAIASEVKTPPATIADMKATIANLQAQLAKSQK